jgi:lambda repressor-like predicted transcriptional regulator
MDAKSPYTEAENDKLRTAVLALLEARGWSQVEASRHFGVAQQTLSSFLRRRSGAGRTFVRALEKLTGKTEAQLLGVDGARGAFRSQPGWDKAVIQARALFAEIPEYVFVEIGAWSSPAAGIEPNPLLIGRIAQDWWSMASAEARNMAMRAHRHVTMAAEDESHSRATHHRKAR